jgi:hypothetical protein
MTKDRSTKIINQHGPAGFMAFVAWFGAVVYFVHQSQGFWGFILAILKACVWPAYVVYHALLFMHA